MGKDRRAEAEHDMLAAVGNGNAWPPWSRRQVFSNALFLGSKVTGMDFTAIDVETANPDLASICQIGVVQFSAGRVANRWKSLINPQDEFAPVNVRIHGINEEAVRSAPLFGDVKPALDNLLQSSVVCCHTAFDRHAIRAVHVKHQLDPPRVAWLDTSRVVRQAWPERASSGYGLGPVAEMLGIAFRHHDAEEDARAAGEILLRAIAHTGRSVQDWLAVLGGPKRQARTGTGLNGMGHANHGNAEGPLVGETVVFTGRLSVERTVAAEMSVEAGGDVGKNVTSKTTILVVGDQDVRNLQGHDKSSKHRRAEELIAMGQELRILQESDFYDLLSRP